MKEEVVDLSAPADSFHPYVFNREPFWMVLPLVALLVVFWHLKRARR